MSDGSRESPEGRSHAVEGTGRRMEDHSVVRRLTGGGSWQTVAAAQASTAAASSSRHRRDHGSHHRPAELQSARWARAHLLRCPSEDLAGNDADGGPAQQRRHVGNVRLRDDQRQHDRGSHLLGSGAATGTDTSCRRSAGTTTCGRAPTRPTLAAQSGTYHYDYSRNGTFHRNTGTNHRYGADVTLPPVTLRGSHGYSNYSDIYFHFGVSGGATYHHFRPCTKKSLKTVITGPRGFTDESSPELAVAEGIRFTYHVGDHSYADSWPSQIVLCPRSCNPWDTGKPPDLGKWPSPPPGARQD